MTTMTVQLFPRVTTVLELIQTKTLHRMRRLNNNNYTITFLILRIKFNLYHLVTLLKNKMFVAFICFFANIIPCLESKVMFISEQVVKVYIYKALNQFVSSAVIHKGVRALASGEPVES